MMDLTPLLGLLLAIAGILAGQFFEGGQFTSLLQPSAFLIVFAGTVGAVLVQSPWSLFLRACKMAIWLVHLPQLEGQQMVEQMQEWAAQVRKLGLLALEADSLVYPDLFVRNGLQMLADGYAGDQLHAALEVEITAHENSQRQAARVWEAAGGYAPTIGIMGAVLGLIQIMENLSDPSRLGAGIAVAFVSTIYGLALANLFFLPTAGRLRHLIGRETLWREMVREGFVGIANGENPRLIAGRMQSYLG